MVLIVLSSHDERITRPSVLLKPTFKHSCQKDRRLFSFYSYPQTKQDYTQSIKESSNDEGFFHVPNTLPQQCAWWLSWSGKAGKFLCSWEFAGSEILKYLAHATQRHLKTHRPCEPSESTFEEWLDKQGSDSTFFRPSPDIIGFNNGDPSVAFEDVRFGLFDYAGIWYEHYGNKWDTPTQVEGSVDIKCIQGNKELVTVKVKVTHAIGWVVDIQTLFADCGFDCPENAGFQPLVGNLPQYVANGEAVGAFGDGEYIEVFTRPTGAPFVDSVDRNRNGWPKGYDIKFVAWSARYVSGKERGLLLCDWSFFADSQYRLIAKIKSFTGPGGTAEQKQICLFYDCVRGEEDCCITEDVFITE